MLKWLPAIAAVTLATAMQACGDRSGGNYRTLDGFALGTTYHITVDMKDTAGLKKTLENVLETAEGSMSIYREGSLISRLNRNETDSVDTFIARCITIAREGSRLTGGEYDITVKPLVEAWGFAGRQASKSPNVDSLLQYVGYEKIRVEGGRLIKDDPRVQIDLNSVAKGLTVDMVAEALRGRGAVNYLVEIGGEVACSGINSKGIPWVIAIDRPEDGNYIPGMDIQAMISISGVGLATSGNYRKFYVDGHGRKVSHTINALTGQSVPGNLLSATVIAGDCATADALGTAMMVLGLERAQKLLAEIPGVMGLLVYADENGGMRTFTTDNLRPHIIE